MFGINCNIIIDNMCDNCCTKKKPTCCIKSCCVQTCCVQPCCEPVMTDCLAEQIQCIWKEAFCDATILPVLGMPSCNNCVMTLTHTLGRCVPCIKINGLVSKSMLVNNCFYSAEVSCGKWMNFYKGLIPNVPGKCGCKSSGEIYIEALIGFGISVDNDNYNWKGACPELLAINSSAINMEPCDFSRKQICALQAVLNYIKKCN